MVRPVSQPIQPRYNDSAMVPRQSTKNAPRRASRQLGNVAGLASVHALACLPPATRGALAVVRDLSAKIRCRPANCGI
eukprot:11159176-Lingulodinium_polyedra.AAC.1